MEHGAAAGEEGEDRGPMRPIEIDSASDTTSEIDDVATTEIDSASDTTTREVHSERDSVDMLFRLWEEGPVHPDAGDTDVSQVLQPPLRVAPRVCPSETNVAEELRPLWRQHKQQAADIAACVDIRFCAAQDLGSSLHAIVTQGCDSFYVGATVDPVRRWLGDVGLEIVGLAGRCQGTRGPLPGHIGCWAHMQVCGLFDGATARGREASLIKYGKELWEHGCCNVALDARGVSVSMPAFVYVVWR